MKVFNKQNISITIISSSQKGVDLSSLLEEVGKDLIHKKKIIKYSEHKEGTIDFNEKNSKDSLIRVLFYNFKELTVNYIDSRSLFKSFDNYTDVLLNTDIVLVHLDKSTRDNLGNILDKLYNLKTKGLGNISLVYERSDKDSYLDIYKYVSMINDIVIYSSYEEFILKLIFVIKNKLDIDNLKLVNSSLKQLSNTDELTGLYNMRAFWNLYAGSMIDCKKSKGSYSVFMLDIDNFKQVNDRYDHLIGSNILAEIGSIFLHNNNITNSDYVARYGGDEYILVKKNDSYKDMMNFAKELVEIFSEHTFEYGSYTINITISLGCVFVGSGFCGCDEDPIKVADLLLYKSKITGKNKFFGIELKKEDDIDSKMENIVKDIKELRAMNFKESDGIDDRVQCSLDLDSILYDNKKIKYNKDNENTQSNINKDSDNDDKISVDIKKVV